MHIFSKRHEMMPHAPQFPVYSMAAI